MTADGPATPPAGGRERPRSRAAQERLARALRENLKRRKTQVRAREAAAAPAPKKNSQT